MEHKNSRIKTYVVISTLCLVAGAAHLRNESDIQRPDAQILSLLDLEKAPLTFETSQTETETIAAVPAAPAEISEAHLKAADMYIGFMAARNNFFGARYTGCFKAKNPIFCDTLYPSKNVSTKTKDASLGVPKNLKLIRQGNLKKIEIGNHAESVQIVKQLSESSRKNLQKLVLSKKGCTSPHLISALAFRAEEELPARKAFDNVYALYKRSFECSQNIDDGKHQDVWSERGLYRLGLFAVQKNELTVAQQAFEKLMVVTDDSNTFKARAQYWLNQVKRQQGEVITAESLQEQFVNFPMSYHVAKEASQEGDIPFEHISQLTAQGLMMRSQTQESLNDSVQLFEALIQKDRPELARRVLEFINLQKLSQAEPEFQMYVASLMNRYEDMNHEKFKILTKVFQNNPQFKTVENLKIYYPLLYSDLILKSAGKQDPTLIISLMRQESSFNPETQSPVGARGLMQIMSRTAKELKSNIKDKDLLDPKVNVPLGSKYFGALLREFRGDPHKALAAYNAGAGNVKKWMKRYQVTDEVLFADLIPFDETREYVSTILRNRYWYGKLYPELTAGKSLALGNPQAGN